MTDLLTLLSGIHRAVTLRGDLRLALTDVEGHAGAVDRDTGTIHISPGLSLPEVLRVLADGVDTLAPTAEHSPPAQIAVGGDSGDVAIPHPRHLRAVPDA